MLKIMLPTTDSYCVVHLMEMYLTTGSDDGRTGIRSPMCATGPE